MQIYVLQNDEQAGPYTPAQFDDMLQKGALGEDDLYWHEGCAEWQPVSRHPSFPQPLVVLPPAAAASSRSSPPPPPPPRPRFIPVVRPVVFQQPPPAAGALKFCPACSHPVAPSAPSCPNCGGRLGMGCLPKTAIGCGVLATLTLVLWLFLGFLGLLVTRQDQSKRTRWSPSDVDASSSSRGSRAASTTPLPEAERSLIASVELYAARYSAAGNELQKSAVRTERRLGMAGVCKDMEVSGWIGTLKRLDTFSDGKATISIQLEGSAISVHTDLGNPFDRGSSTLIEHGSALYNKLASLSVGDRVVFSGTFLRGERDYLKETSITESGSMSAPDFVMRFADVAAATAANSSAASPPAATASAPEEAASPAARETPPPLVPTATANSTPPGGLSPAASAASPVPTTAAAFLPSPRAIVTDFYAWYLQEIRQGKSPWLSGELARRSEVSPSFAIRLEGAKEPEPGDDPIFAAREVPGRFLLITDKVNRFDATVAVRLTFGFGSQLVNVRLVRSDEGDPWRIEDVQPVLAAAASSPPAPAPSAAAAAATADSSPAPPTSPTPPAAEMTAAAFSEALLIGRWQGPRHLTEYRADHTRLMDGVATNPPRTWQLEGDQLTEYPGRSVYQVVALDQNQLVLQDNEGKRYLHQRVQAPAVAAPASLPANGPPPANRDDPFTRGFQDGIRAAGGTLSATPSAVEPTPTPTPATAPPEANRWASGSWPIVLYNGTKIPWRLPLPGYWHLKKQPLDANADGSWEGPKGVVLTAYSFDEDDTDDFWKALGNSAHVFQVNGSRVGQKPSHDPNSLLGYNTFAQLMGGLQMRAVAIVRVSSKSDKLLAVSIRTPSELPQTVLQAVYFDVSYFLCCGQNLLERNGPPVDLSQRVTAKNDKLLMELARATTPQNVVAPTPTPADPAAPPTLLTKAQWKEKMARNFRYIPGTPVMGAAQQFQQIMGRPNRTQTVGDRAYWYYQCADGTIQLVTDALALQLNYIQADVNDY